MTNKKDTIKEMLVSYQKELKAKGASATILLAEIDEKSCTQALEGNMVSFMTLFTAGMLAALENLDAKDRRQIVWETFKGLVEGHLKEMGETPDEEEDDKEDETAEEEANEEPLYAAKIPRNSKQGKALTSFLNSLLEDVEAEEDED